MSAPDGTMPLWVEGGRCPSHPVPHPFPYLTPCGFAGRRRGTTRPVPHPFLSPPSFIPPKSHRRAMFCPPDTPHPAPPPNAGILNNDIKWNFSKFLVDKEGKVVGR